MTRRSRKESGRGPRKRAAQVASPTAEPESKQPTSGAGAARRALLLPLGFTALLAAFGVLPSSLANPTLQWSFFGAAAILLLWNLFLGGAAARRGRVLTVEWAARPQHYLQACAHLSIYVYWGWYWRQVYDSAHLIAAQLVFAYALDMLLVWSRREKYTLGFGPFPIIFSTNLFLWFKPDWFYLQFLMVALGFLTKELVRWKRDGRSTHVFNPSSFPLSVFSLGLLLSGTTDHTWGREIATTLFYPPHIFLWIFLIGLPGQLLFGVTTMTLSAVVTASAFSAVYLAITGTYFFFDAHVPIAVFLGMHLLFTDPSTSPRTELGRILFGVLYGSGVVFLYWFLGALGTFTFYDKLLPVPILNLLVPGIDRLVRSPSLARFDPARLGEQLTPRRRNLVYMSVWAVVFTVLSLTNSLADTHPGNRIPFWQKACAEGKRNGCRNLATMESKFCYLGMGWACNELAILVADDKVTTEATATQLFERACEAGFKVGCDNLQRSRMGSVGKSVARVLGTYKHQPPQPADQERMLETKGFPPVDGSKLQLMKNACDQGWTDSCVAMAFMYLRGDGVAPDPARAVAELDKLCTAGEAGACSDLGLMYRKGDGVPRDDVRALQQLQKACDLKMADACRWLEQERGLLRPQLGR